MEDSGVYFYIAIYYLKMLKHYRWEKKFLHIIFFFFFFFTLFVLSLVKVHVDPATETIEKRVIDWKFDQLDKNHDGYLNRREFRVLRRLVRKVVRPKRCTKNFPRLCDSDQDRKISRSEWSVCLGVGINSKQSILISFQVKKKKKE